MTRVYLDANATARLRPEARAAMTAALSVTGNPSSIHGEGRAARRLVEEARDTVAALMQARPADVVFTSGATEAANTLLVPDAGATNATAAWLLVGATEHVSVLNGHRFLRDRASVMPVDGDGRIDARAVAQAAAALTAGHGTAAVVVAIQAANNETGVLQPIYEIVRRLRGSGALLVCDAAQYAGKLPFPPASFDADALILSSHKLGGPQGAGAIVYRGDYFRPAPLLRGGGQERGRRAGTENVAAIAGFAAAAKAAFGDAAAFAARTSAMRDGLEAWLRQRHPNLVVFGERAERLPNTSCFAVPGILAETLLIALDLAGVAVSSGSACSSGKVAPSHVLAAMAVPAALAKCALRLSFGWESAEKDLDSFTRAWTNVVSRIASETTAAA